MLRPLPSTSSVRASQAARTSASSPTATIAPARIATAEANGRAGSSVRMRAPTIARSAAVRRAPRAVADSSVWPAVQQSVLVIQGRDSSTDTAR